MRNTLRSALRCCRRALNTSPSHYLALVFSALCQAETEQYEQAIQSYHKATGSDPKQLVGWQGLASFYEKHSGKMGDSGKEERDADLARVYSELAGLQTDEDKAFETRNKLWRLLANIGKVSDAADVLRGQLEKGRRVKEAKGRRVKEARANAIELLGKQAGLDEELEAFFVQVLQEALDDGRGDQSIQSMENYKTLIKQHYK